MTALFIKRSALTGSRNLSLRAAIVTASWLVVTLSGCIDSSDTSPTDALLAENNPYIAQDGYTQTQSPDNRGVPAETPPTVAPVGSLIDRLALRLQQNPDDVEGWVLLARSYYFLGDKPRAQHAAQEAKKRGYSGQINYHAAQTTSSTQLPPNHPPIGNDTTMTLLNDLLEEK